ncbi:MAG TPA: hypothetical protein VI434_12670 [Candidatus Dormibacteraeota bacterium]
MGRRNIYIRDEDEGVWETAAALAGKEQSMSQIIVRGLKDYISTREGEALEMLLVEVEDEHGQKSAKKFSGRWLISNFSSTGGDVWVSHAGAARTVNHDCDETPWWVAETARGQIAVWANPPAGAGGFYVYRDLDEAEENGIPGDVVSAASRALGIQRAELLDI